MPEYLPLTAIGNHDRQWRSRATCRKYDPDIWHNTASVDQARSICQGCPVIRDCAADTLRIAAERTYRPNGVWASINVPLKPEAGEYRKLLQHLRFIAATGIQPLTRNRRRPEVADHADIEQGIAV
ncbi:WhiB family transcriptional regulator [Mycobacteroides abscessus]|uniref:WhiB family transcriptional regulator n=1 Tax=Mycobacteroides abscessus TaxID=36809 RepID=UPI000C269D60|nr:WhiB family transcriptional regulator [Mycobacteroides abscessus]